MWKKLKGETIVGKIIRIVKPGGKLFCHISRSEFILITNTGFQSGDRSIRPRCNKVPDSRQKSFMPGSIAFIARSPKADEGIQRPGEKVDLNSIHVS